MICQNWIYTASSDGSRIRLTYNLFIQVLLIRQNKYFMIELTRHWGSHSNFDHGHDQGNNEDTPPSMPMWMISAAHLFRLITCIMKTIAINKAILLITNATTHFLSLLRSTSEFTFTPHKIVVWVRLLSLFKLSRILVCCPNFQTITNNIDFAKTN